MIKDMKGKVVQEGDVIEFQFDFPMIKKGYKIVRRNGELGAYEDDEFIALKDVLRNFIIINR